MHMFRPRGFCRSTTEYTKVFFFFFLLSNLVCLGQNGSLSAPITPSAHRQGSKELVLGSPAYPISQQLLYPIGVQK